MPRNKLLREEGQFAFWRLCCGRGPGLYHPPSKPQKKKKKKRGGRNQLRVCVFFFFFFPLLLPCGLPSLGPTTPRHTGRTSPPLPPDPPRRVPWSPPFLPPSLPPPCGQLSAHTPSPCPPSLAWLAPLPLSLAALPGGLPPSFSPFLLPMPPRG